MSTNSDEAVRDKLIRFLYERHKNTKSIGKIPIGIRDLQREMKARHNLKQSEVASNLDYLIQIGWVKEVIKERNFTTPGGMELSQEQVKYKISDVGINYLQSATVFKRPDSYERINITNIQGVTVVGDGNIVNNELTELARALTELDKQIGVSGELGDAAKLDAAGDVATIRTQISKQHPNNQVIATAWESLKGIATIASLAEKAHKVGNLIAGLLS